MGGHAVTFTRCQHPIEISGNSVAAIPLSASDREHLMTTDAEFHFHTWDELKEIIAQNRLEVLRRKPSDLARYIEWSRKIKVEYGNIMNYICQQRLKWTPLPSSTPESGPKFECKNPVPFVEEDDYKILPNDWPYGLESGITHLVVWLKNKVPTEPTRGEMTPEGRGLVQQFVQKKFIDRVVGLPGPEEKILWFKNWTALQSVPGMEHVHILVRGVPDDLILQWTDGETQTQ